MSNIIISPQSGILEFNTGAASGSAFDGSLSGAARLKFESSGVLGLTSLGTGVTDKFTIDGSNGRLFTVNNTVTGSIFSVNDVAGLPIVEVFSDDRVVMGKYATDALVVSGSGVSFANVPTVSGNPIMTGVSSEDVDTLATVTARGATTTSSITTNGLTSNGNITTSSNGIGIFTRTLAARDSNGLAIRESTSSSGISINSAGNTTIDGNITVASSKHIGIGSTLAAIQFGDGSVGNETADLSFVTNSDGEITFHRGENKLIMGTDHNFVNGEIFVNDGLRIGTTTHKGIGGNELFTISGGGGSIPSQTWTNAHSSALYLRNYNNANGEWQLQPYNGGNGGVIQLAPYGGNVTIGNLTASAKLDIKTDSNAAIRCESATGGHFIVDHGGKVGIQTHSPQYALHIDNNGNLNPANVLIDSTTTADASISFSHNGTFGFTIGTDESDGKKFKISSGDALGSNNLMTFTHDKVGIGNTNPQDFSSAANRLVVGDGVGNEGMSIFAGTSNTSAIYFADGTAGAAAYQGFLQYRHNNSDLKFGAGGGSRMVMNGNGLLINPDGGPPFAPNAELEIASSVPTIRLTDFDLTNTFSEIEKGGDYLYFYSRANSSNGGFLFAGDNGTTETEFLRIDTAGNVGIGTNSPQAELHVDGDFIIDTDTATKAFYVTRLGNTNESLKINVDDSSAIFEVIQDENSAAYGNYHFKTDINDNTTYYRYDIGGSEVMRLTANGLEIKGNQNADHPRIHFQASDASNRFTIETDLDSTTTNDTLGFVGSFGEAYKKDILFLKGNGNVGIGTNNPAYKLDVIDSDGGTLARFKDSDSSHAGLIIQGDVNGGSITNASAFTSEVIYLQNSANAMRFYTDGTEAVRIDSSQRVGIGTNSVLGTLQVNGRALIESPSVPTTLTVSDSGDATKAIRIGYEPTWDVGSISASDYGAGWKNIVIAPHAGNVGIGVTDPDEKLEVDGNIKISAGKFLRMAGNGYQIGTDGTPSRIQFHAGSSERMFISGNGNVSIGTDIAPQRLNVKGTIVHLNASNIQVAGMTNSSNDGRLYANNAGGVSKVLLDSNGNSYLDGGNVGIGTNSPATTLDVDGLISSDQIRSKKYTSLSGSSNDWFPIGSINEHLTGPVLFQVITAYHSNMSFIVAKGYGPSQEHSITLLSSIDSNNTGYASIKGVRVRQDGQVEIQLYWASGPSVVVNVTARSTTDPVSLPSSLATSTSSENVVDTVTNEDGKLRSRKLITTSSNVQLSDNGISYLNGGNVGIGVADPDATLEVKGAGNTNATTSFVVRDSDDAVLLKARNDGVVTVEHGYFYVSASAGAYVQNNFRVRGSLFNDQGTLQIGNSSGTAFDGDVNFDANTLFVDSSTNRIGIGTTTPDALLHVYSAGNGEIEVERNGGAKINLQAQASKGVIGTDSNHQLDLKTNGGTRMSLLTNGDVGIGTTAPLDMLHIYGSVRADLKLEGAFQGGATDVGKLQFAYGPRSGDVNHRNIASISAYNTTTDSGAGAYLSITTRATSGSMSERIRVNQDGQVDIYGNASFASYLYHKGDEDTNIKFNTDDFIINVGGAAFFRATETTQNTIKLNSDSQDTDFYLYSTSSTPAIFMRGSDGEVGIGTNNPVQKLQVNGSIYAAGGHFYVDNDKSLTSVGDLRLKTNNGTTAVFIDTSQNVGIGTTDPSSLNAAANDLVVGDGAGNHGVTIFAGNSSTSSLYLADGTAGDQAYRGYITYSHAAEKLSLGAGGQTRITATNAGLVGINQTNPTSKLHIYGGNVTGLAGSLRNDSKNRMNMKVAMADVTRYIGTVTQYGNGDSSGFTIRLYDGAEKVFRIIRVVVQNSSGTNYPSITVEGGGEDTDIHIDLKYKNRDGDATKTDFFLDPTGTKYFNQYIEIEGFIFKEEGYNTTSLTSVSLDDDLALNILDHGNGSRVGVGTTDPSAKFHAEGSMIVKGDAGWAGTDNQNGALFMNTNGRGLLGAFSTSYARPLITANSNYIDLGSAGTSLINGFRYYAGSSSSSVGTHNFYTNGSDNRLHIAKDGKVGIGSETPAEVLDVVGLIRFAHTRANNSQKIGRLLIPEYNNSHGQFVAFMGTANETSNAVSYGGGTSSADAATTLLFYTASAVNTTVGTERMRITSAGNVGIGVSGDPSDKLEVNGSFSASSKTFNIEHPTKSGKRLIHGCFEGPEYGVYFRGKTQDNCIKAPEYWSGLVDIDSMTVDITPIGPNQNIYVDRIEDNGDIYVGANTDEPLNYFYVVYGERKDIDKLEIVKDAPVASPNQVVD